MKNVRAANRAYEAHGGPKVMVRYEEKKGRGKFHRKAKPGGWREHLTPHQARSVENIAAPLLREFYGGESER